MAVQMPPAAPHPGPAAFGRKLPMHNEEMPKAPTFGHAEAPKFGSSHPEDEDQFHHASAEYARDVETEPDPERKSLKDRVKDTLKAPFKKLAQLFRKGKD
jgi:hypothetical protein